MWSLFLNKSTGYDSSKSKFLYIEQINTFFNLTFLCKVARIMGVRETCRREELLLQEEILTI